MVVADFDGDNWKDIVVANTDFQPTHYYKNLGSNGSGQWLGLQFETGRIPNFTPGPRFCSAAGGDADNDGDIDLFLGDYNNTLENRLLINDGTGHFTDQTATRFVGRRSVERILVRGGLHRLQQRRRAGHHGHPGRLDWHPHEQVGGVVGPVHGADQRRTATRTTRPRPGDLNNDGKVDIYAGQDGQDGYLINTTAPGAMTPTFTTTTLQSNNAALPNFSPHTQGFAGNPYIVDMDGDG